ncbi:tetratricopeptide repeat protein [Riemerella anatipestifer]|uniref:type IX secretion system periplasmic lipoprotein PorW/SprE n=2 Tax=Riemerella anatipestifer TaxID=34085 RepID=UPI001F1DFF23|nr:tetratricopeptide repeat protein [Riemerella anatipestifer]MCO7317062.1 tetratricopeptide repeat protein [Riemerella anatipestifer]MCO7325072.1 tetratricopeptide repeat protein [Riemerella anatipestifer]MCQ4037701.1 tetratricopeptide repeat protein [Riemerella anatipestifer]MCQ4064161.1 tetratricopeptide repeat protein [Riemerella anatipestifer]MCQ4157675.1 tetratricopeptide repeat protein [Riemerella anatipestifer]
MQLKHQMKKYSYFLIILALAVACSPRKNTFVNRNYQSFYAYYNTLFNSKDALESELNTRKNSHQDNFYQPYIKLLTFDNDHEIESENNTLDAQNAPFAAGASSISYSSPNSKKGMSVLEISEAKALKTIEQHAMLFDGKEKNKRIFEAQLMLAKARMYQEKYLEALDALNYIFSHMKEDKRLPLAKIYEAKIFSLMKDYYKANEIFMALKEEKLSKSDKKLLSIFYAESLLQSGQKEAAVEELAQAYALNKNKNLRSRIAFLRGQILSKLGRNEEARESFVTAYQKANNFEFEVKSQIEIAKTFDNSKKEDYESLKTYLEKISKKGTYASRKNEFYYALGLMAMKAGKEEEANKFFQKSLKEKVSDGQIRGLTYYEIGKKYLEKEDYLSAGVYYDSAVTQMTYAPQREELKTFSTDIKKISKNYYLIKKNDSILALTKMNDQQRLAYFNQQIEKLKAKEAKEEAEKLKASKEKEFKVADFVLDNTFGTNSTRGFADFGTSTKGFYFDNLTTVSKGQANFKQIWGERALADNWRYSSKTTSIEDLKNEALGKTEVKNPRRFEPEFYIEKIPTNAQDIAQLKQDRDTASLGLGMMYENIFSNTKLATKTLFDLVNAQPKEDVKLQALYQIFSINYEKNPQEAQKAKNIIISEFPYTHYAEFVKNPKRGGLGVASSEVENIYKQAYQLYIEEKYEDSKALIEKTIEAYPKDALLPKLSLLNAFNTGKTVGKEIMILQLQQISLNYEKLPEGEKAKQMLAYLSSDLKTPITEQSKTAQPSVSITVTDETAKDHEEEAPNLNLAPSTVPPQINLNELRKQKLQKETIKVSPK